MEGLGDSSVGTMLSKQGMSALLSYSGGMDTGRLWEFTGQLVYLNQEVTDTVALSQINIYLECF